MPNFTIEHFCDAIDRGNLGDIQEILRERNEAGMPVLDLNQEFGNASSALMYALWREPINVAIFLTLLFLRDAAGNPIINLNSIGPHGQTILSFILSLEDTEMRRRLLQEVLSLRLANQELAVDLNVDNCNIPLLVQACNKGDVNSLRMLMDVRYADGTRMLDINEIRHGRTVLDYALEDAMLRIPNPVMILAIQAFGGVEARNRPVQRPVRQDQQPNIPVQQPVHQQQQPNRAGPQGSQNTHAPIMEKTSDASIASLIKFYENRLDTVDFQEIKNFISRFNFETILNTRTLAEKREGSKSFIDTMIGYCQQNYDFHGNELGNVVKAVWLGINDADIESFPSDMRSNISQPAEAQLQAYVKLKRDSFAEKCVEAFQAYRDEGSDFDICLGGGVHKLLESLNRTHVEVYLLVDQDMGVSFATDFACITLGDELLKKSRKEQLAILADWGNDDGPAFEFRNQVKNPIDNRLKQYFDVLLTENDRLGIVNKIQDLPRPSVPHSGFSARLDELENNSFIVLSSPKAKAFIKIKDNALALCLDLNMTDDDKLKAIDHQLSQFNDLSKLIEDIKKLPDHDECAGKADYIKQLKDMAAKVDWGKIDESTVVLLEIKKGFNQLSQLIENINKLPDADPCMGRNLPIQTLKTYASYGYSLSEDHQKDLETAYAELENIDKQVGIDLREKQYLYLIPTAALVVAISTGAALMFTMIPLLSGLDIAVKVIVPFILGMAGMVAGVPLKDYRLTMLQNSAYGKNTFLPAYEGIAYVAPNKNIQVTPFANTLS